MCEYVTAVAQRELHDIHYRSKAVNEIAASSLPWITNTTVFDGWSAQNQGRSLHIDWEGAEPGPNMTERHIVAIADALLEVSTQFDNVYLTNLDLRHYNRLATEVRQCRDHRCEHCQRNKGEPHYRTVYKRLPVSTQEIVMAFACVQLARNADQTELATRISGLYTNHQCMLEKVASEASLNGGSQVDYTMVLREYSPLAICDFLASSLRMLPSQSLHLFSICHFEGSVIDSPIHFSSNLLDGTSIRSVIHAYGSRPSGELAPWDFTINHRTEYLGTILTDRSHNCFECESNVLCRMSQLFESSRSFDPTKPDPPTRSRNIQLVTRSSVFSHLEGQWRCFVDSR